MLTRSASCPNDSLFGSSGHSARTTTGFRPEEDDLIWRVYLLLKDQVSIYPIAFFLYIFSRFACTTTYGKAIDLCSSIPLEPLERLSFVHIENGLAKRLVILHIYHPTFNLIASETALDRVKRRRVHLVHIKRLLSSTDKTVEQHLSSLHGDQIEFSYANRQELE